MISVENVKTAIRIMANWKWRLVLTVFSGIGLRGFQQCILG